MAVAMNIIDLLVIDPRKGGDLVDPYAIVTTDEPVEEIGEHIYKEAEEHAYSVIPCGPFYAIEVCAIDLDSVEPKGGWGDLADSSVGSFGELNRLNILGGKQLFPVSVRDELLPLAMEVPRLRRLLRKFESTYKLLIDEQAALSGLLQWRLELSVPMCYIGALTGAGDPCLREPTTTVMWRDAHLSLCEPHLESYQALRRDRRTSTPTGRHAS
jgi:hypothetical protein